MNDIRVMTDEQGEPWFVASEVPRSKAPASSVVGSPGQDPPHAGRSQPGNPHPY